MIIVVLVLINFTLNNKLNSFAREKAKIDFSIIETLKAKFEPIIEIKKMNSDEINCWNMLWSNKTPYAKNNFIYGVMKDAAVAAFKGQYTNTQMKKSFENIVKMIQDQKCKDFLTKFLTKGSHTGGNGQGLPPAKILIAKIGEVCYQSTPNFPKTKCEKGFECRQRAGTPVGMTGGSSICQLPLLTLKPEPTLTKHHTGGNQIINKTYSKIVKPEKVYMTGVNGQGINPALRLRNNNNNNPVKEMAKEGEKCAEHNAFFVRRTCARGLECRQKRVKQGNMYIMTSSSPSYCQKRKLATNNNPIPVIYKPISDKGGEKDKPKRRRKSFFTGAISTHRNQDYLNKDFYKSLNKN